MNIFPIIAVAILAQAQQDSEILKPDPSILSGFTLNRVYNKLGAAVMYRRTSDKARLDISARTIAEGEDVEQWWHQVSTHSLYVPDRPQTPGSGLPLGDRCVDNRGKMGGLLQTMSGRMSVDVLLDNSPMDETDLNLQEGAARYAVAKVRGLESRLAGDATVNGKNVDHCRRSPSGAVLVPLDKWATATGVNVIWNKVRGTAAFTHGGESYIFALGATKLKKDGRWWDCGDTLSWCGGHWYAPLSLLGN